MRPNLSPQGPGTGLILNQGWGSTWTRDGANLGRSGPDGIPSRLIWDPYELICDLLEPILEPVWGLFGTCLGPIWESFGELFAISESKTLLNCSCVKLLS